MSRYYNRDGTPSVGWPALTDDDRHVLRSRPVSGVLVSTVFLALNHAWDNGPPLIFETMIFGGPHDKSQWRYSTEAAARAGHERIVAALEAGEAPPEILPR